MLYINKIDSNTIRFADAADGSGVKKLLPITLRARSDEKERVWITNPDYDEDLLVAKDPSEITLEGVVYNASTFVTQFNNICGKTISGIGGGTTTTTTTAAVTTTTTAAATTTTSSV